MVNPRVLLSLKQQIKLNNMWIETKENQAMVNLEHCDKIYKKNYVREDTSTAFMITLLNIDSDIEELVFDTLEERDDFYEVIKQQLIGGRDEK